MRYFRNLFRCFVFVSVLLGACTSSTIQPDPVYRETEVRHDRPRLNGEKFDAQEFDPKLAPMFSDVDAMAERQVGGVPRNNQFILKFWQKKKEILLEEYGVDWESPAELNPNIAYDDYGQPKLTALERSCLADLVMQHIGRSQTVHGMYRGFDGTVYVSTTDGSTVWQHRLAGHDDDWVYLDSGALEE